MNLQFLLSLLAVPALLLIVIWLVRADRLMTILAAGLFWVQTVVIASQLMPLLTGAESQLILLKDFSIDRLGSMFVVLTQIVVACSMTHAHIFFKFEKDHEPGDSVNLRFFYSWATLLMPAMTAVFFCNNLGIMWICIEATTLCSAPLVYFHKDKHSLEAAWKYLMICGVGIAFALFGTMFIVASSQQGAIEAGSLNLDDLMKNAGQLQYPLLRLGYLFCLLGYGTKAGMFPLHGWLPDAYSEAPAPASALLSGGLLNCSLFAIWRISELVNASGHPALPQTIGIWSGVISVLFASVFLIRQHGIKRLFAYSSIENVGLMLTAIGLNSGNLFFILALNLSAAKVALFLLAGNIVQATGTKSLNEIRGVMATNPYWAVFLMLAVFAITGAPPFGAFIAEWQLLLKICQLQQWTSFCILLGALALSFLAITMHFGKIVAGRPRKRVLKLPAFGSSVVPACLVLLTLVCGLTALPKPLW
ncbi:MAG TPA: proton-conducting transporter membrane subunit [Oculatellaceae cyanobacterium]